VRRAVIDRRTTETAIALKIELDGKGSPRADRHPLPRSHAGAVRASRRLRPDGRREGDLDVDQHHTVEDLGIALGRLSLLRSARGAASTAPAIS
jgi:imidazoleglycerol-phosphate dehydratase